MNMEDLLYSMRGVDPKAKKIYMKLLNGSSTRKEAKILIEDLMIRFRYYGAKPTTDPIQLAKNAAYREVIEYILTMAARISDDTLEDIEKFINK